MNSQRNHSPKLLIIMTVLLLSTLACAGFEKTSCIYLEGGEWISYESIPNHFGGCCKTPKNDCSTGRILQNPLDTSNPGSAPAADNRLQDTNRNTCNGTSSLIITSRITNQETNQFGTRICEYTLTIKNANEELGTWVYFYQHDKDGYAHTEKEHWMGNILIDPGKEENWPGSIYIYDDKDADGPVMSIPERIAGVYNTQECTEEKQDENFFELFSIPLEMVCPME